MNRHSEEAGGGIPPYVPYSAFRNFLDRISKKPPVRIDRSLMRDFSGTTQTQLLSALRYLGLMSADGQTTQVLLKLLTLAGTERGKVFREILIVSYPDLLNDFPIEKATNQMVEKKFRESGASGNTVRKCLAFFLAACNDAGIKVSPYIRPFRGVRDREARPLRLPSAAVAEKRGSDESRTVAAAKMPPLEILLSKFPDLDPTWPNEIKTKWFDEFSKLIECVADKPKRP